MIVALHFFKKGIICDKLKRCLDAFIIILLRTMPVLRFVQWLYGRVFAFRSRGLVQVLPSNCFDSYTPIPHRPRIPLIDKYLDSWLNRTQFAKILTDSHSP